MAMTLIEQAKTEQNTLLRGVIKKFAASAAILELMPFQTIEGNSLEYNTEERLPGIAFRGINEAFDESVGVINPAVETLKTMGGDADSDLFFKRTQKNQDRRAITTKMKVRAAALYFQKIFIDGNKTTTPKEIDGMNQRLAGDQKVSAGTNGAALSSNFVHQVIHAVEDPSAILMGKKMLRQFQNLFESSTVMSVGQDAFGRMIRYFNDLPIRIIDKDNTNSVILDFDETQGSSDVTASFYVVSFGDTKVQGIQSGPIIARDLGEVDDKPVERTRIEWDIGMTILSVYAAARGHGVTASVD